ncbi:M15 family metallopeptidase [Demequina lutea]|uniref:D-alanyl-D-alanine carboxypeptidase n=1 Tax=Demequina lutea TaxID=431489 RepID=A0A7Z0CKL0_9MICO|nr:M15 family metallopeptidase [Demequina lutea]NYI41835.1 D-alanyl-D-alanine carboxypeptidase [Demequina lutea]
MRVALGAGATAAVMMLAACGIDAPRLPFESTPEGVQTQPTVVADAGASAPLVTPGLTIEYDIDDPSAITVVVTKTRPLDPIDYAPADLVSVVGVPGRGSQSLRAVAAEAMTRMYEAALEAGAPFSILSTYRPYGVQRSLYSGYVSASGRAAADRVSARPGFSEHQTGLAADVFDVQANQLKASFGTSAAGEWLAANAYRYGYIVSYPNGKEAVTGYKWEPWHLRFVGLDVAASMHDQGVVTLQEFMGVGASPSYE